MNLRNWALLVFGVVANLGTACAADFAGGGIGVIPDATPAGRDVTFNVSGFTDPIGNVRLKLDITHSFQSDLRATLISPAGVARLIVFARTGYRRATATGVGANFLGEYIFEDGGKDFWVAVETAAAGNVPNGRYRASTAGGVFPTFRTDQGGCATSFEHVFGGLPPANVNGTWTLNIADVVGGDIGNINAATLSISSQQDALFRSGFDPSVRGTCRLAWLDLTGTGRTSYVTVRNTGGGAGGAVTWFVKTNDAVGGGATTSFVHGISTDRFLTGDWDGDGIGDAAVWRPGSPAQFIVRPSSRPTRLLTQDFGVTGDDPSSVGDYDGDRRSDFVVFRSGATSGAPSRTLIRPSGGGPDRDLVTGENGSFPSGGVDYSGDGIADMAVQANAGAGVASFRLYNGVSGTLFQSFNFGAPTNVIITGNHVGDATGDVTVIASVAGAINWTTRDTATGVGQPTVILGASATDFALSGDYDGDGLDDYAVWRASATAGQSRFVVRQSATPAVPLEVLFGQNGDFPVGNARSH